MTAISQRQSLKAQILLQDPAFHLFLQSQPPGPEKAPKSLPAAHRQQTCHFALHVTVLLNFLSFANISQL